MKKNILVKVIAILIIILLCIVSFFGIYKRNLNKWDNILPDYKLGKELTGTRNFSFVIDDGTKEVEQEDENTETTEEETENTESNTEKTEEKTEEKKDDKTDADKKSETSKDDKESDKKSTETAENNSDEKTEDNTEDTAEETTKEVPINSQDVLNVNNYKKSKELIERRLKNFGIVDAVVSLNEENGEIKIETSNSDISNDIPKLVIGKGDFEIIDTETKETLLDRNSIKSAIAYYVPTEDATADNPTYDLGISFEFTSDAQNKLNEITKNYIETTDENGETSQKTVTIRINDTDIYTTYFSPDGTYTSIRVPIFKTVDVNNVESFNDKYRECIAYQAVLAMDELPITYKISDAVYLQTDLNENFILYYAIASGIILFLITIFVIKKFGKNGLLMAIIELGYVALLLLLIRFVSVTVNLPGLVMILFMSILNYIFVSGLDKKDKLGQLKKVLINMIPFFIMILVFNFVKDISLLSIGIIGFWGIIACIYTFVMSLLLLKERNDI